MRGFRALLCLAILPLVLSACAARSQAQQGSQGQQVSQSSTPTFQVTSKLVFLDVTVLDKKGRPVVTGLTKDDFKITEDKKPQRIFSFEAPEAHTLNARGDNPNGVAPRTIFVLDLLNSSFEDFAYIRYEVKRYLDAQPPELRSPAEMMVTGNQSLEMVQGYTRSREDLLDALEHIPPILPYKEMTPSFWAERFSQSIDALQQIALQNRGVPGRKNIIWVGHGGPSVVTAGWPTAWVDELNQYVHVTTNLLVDARMSLFVIYPGLKVNGGMSLSARDAQVVLNDDDPFAGDINFGVFANETGGELFYNRNDVDAEMRESERIGSEYYTLTYQPHNSDDDGRFERIRVTLRDPNLRAVTKAGYFAPDKKAKIDARQRTMINLADAMQSTLPYDALEPKIAGILRHPDNRMVELIVELPQKGLGWLATDNGSSNADLMLSVASLNGNRDILASRIEAYTVTDNTQDRARIAAAKPIQLALTVPMPRRTQSVRVVVETETSGRIGAVEVGRKDIEAAPAAPTPEPQLTGARQRPGVAAAPAPH